jgi:SAM-dependent methyltransferase
MEGERWNAGKVLEVSRSYWEGFVIHAGVKLGIFTIIGDKTLRAEEIAKKLRADPRGASALLDALSAMAFLTKKEGAYANTPEAKALLVKTSPRYVGYAIMHHHNLVPAWFKLGNAVRRGKPVRSKKRDEKELESFLMGMFNMAMAIAPTLAKEIDLRNRKHLLDLGGGPGTYAIQFCLANPMLRAIVFDLPGTRPFATKTIERFSLGDRIRFMPGDYIEDHLTGSYDVAWLSQIIHSMSPEESRMVIRKAVSVLEPGGLILIHDFILNDTKDSPLFPALFSLNMLVNTAQGRSYSEGEIRDMLAGAGVKGITRLPFKGPNDSGIIVGEV